MYNYSSDVTDRMYNYSFVCLEVAINLSRMREISPFCQTELLIIGIRFLPQLKMYHQQTFLKHGWKDTRRTVRAEVLHKVNSGNSVIWYLIKYRIQTVILMNCSCYKIHQLQKSRKLILLVIKLVILDNLFGYRANCLI